MSKKINKIKELEKSNQLLQKNLIDAIWTLDVNTLKFEYMTESIKKISGFSSDEYISLPAKDRMTPQSFEEIAVVLAEEVPKFEKGEKNVRTIEVELIHKNGHLYWAEIKARLYREPDNALKVIGVTKDITKRKKQEQEKNELIKKLEKTLAEKELLLQENKTLKGLLPICSGCKRIRDKNDKWWPLDAYVRKVTEAELTHTICNDCKDVFYEE